MNKNNYTIITGKVTDHPLFNIWSMMKQRCNNPKYSSYYLYGMTEAQIAFDSIAPRFGDYKGKVEIEASIYSNGKSHGSVYNMNDLIEAVNDESPCSYVTIQFVIVRWDKKGTDADRKNTGEEFQFIR